MRIALRTSGGRGEYELVGGHDTVGVTDALDKEIVIQLFPGQHLLTGNIVRRVQGKTRIRLNDKKVDKHLYLILAEALLMPKPKRELAATPTGKLQLTPDNYSIVSIQFDVVSTTRTQLVVQPSNLVLQNADGDQARIDVLERMRILLDVWGSASIRSDALGTRLVRHRDAVRSGDSEAIHESASAIRSAFASDDPLREVLRLLSLLDQYTYWLGIHTDYIEESLLDENTAPIIETNRQRIQQWRLQASRGAAGQRFSRDVKAAYNSTCIVSGHFLPKLDKFVSAGVDSAHILPWADHGINTVQNGLCLGKLYHWAFDNGVIRLTFHPIAGVYKVSISDEALEQERKMTINLHMFRDVIGPVPAHRLPSDRAAWPSPELLDAYNSAMQS